MKQRYEITEAQLNKLLEASRPTPAIALNCGAPASPQENANAAWAALGREMGFDPFTVEPTGEGDRFFTASPVSAAALQSCPLGA